jgi:hypothetical protein
MTDQRRTTTGERPRESASYSEIVTAARDRSPSAERGGASHTAFYETIEAAA